MSLSPKPAGSALPPCATHPRAGQRRSLLRLRLDPYYLLVALLALFPMAPLFQPGYFWDAHDARHSVYFLFELDRGIQDGILYPRWQPDFAFGYGYPFFNIYGPLSSYAGEAFHLLGLGFADSVKIVFGLSLVASGLAMYGFVKRAIGRRAGLVAAIAYMVIPYRLVDLFVRAALAESVAFVFIPLVLWGVWAAVVRPRLTNVLGLALSYAALVLTHPLTALLLTVILLFLIVFLALARVNESQPLRRVSSQSVLPLVGHLAHVLIPVGFGLLLGLGLCAFFILPATTETRFVRVDQWYGGRYAWGGDFVEFFQLFSPRWGLGTSVPGPNDSMSFQLGIVPAVLGLFGVLTLFWREHPLRLHSPHDNSPALPQVRGEPQYQRKEEGARLITFFAVLLVVAIFLMLGLSSPLWRVLPLARLVQFPWRLLGVAVICLAFLSGAVLWRARPQDRAERRHGDRYPGFAAISLGLLLVLGSLPYMQAQMSEREVSLAGLMQFQQSSDEMTGSTAWVKEIPQWSSMADYYIAGKPITSKVDYSLLYQQPGVKAQTLELHTDRELVEYLAPQTALITFDTFYYPGWHAYLLERDTNHVVRELAITQRGDLGLMTVEVPPGIGRVLLRFEDTTMRRVAKMISLATLIVFVGLVGLRFGARLLSAREPRRRPDEPRSQAGTAGEGIQARSDSQGRED